MSNKPEKPKTIEFTNLLGERVVLNESHKTTPQKIKCYLCGNESEIVSDFHFCGSNGFAHPDCLDHKYEGDSYESN